MLLHLLNFAEDNVQIFLYCSLNVLVQVVIFLLIKIGVSSMFFKTTKSYFNSFVRIVHLRTTLQHQMANIEQAVRNICSSVPFTVLLVNIKSE